MLRAAAPFAALCLAAALAGPARAGEAEDREQARILYDNGVTLYEEGQYERAIQAWEAAYALSREPDLLYNIANALERLGRLREAIDKLNEFRIYAPPDARETTLRRLRALEERLAAEQAAPAAPPPSAPPAAPPPAARDSRPLRIAGAVLTGLAAGTAGAGAGLYATAAARASTASASCVDLSGNLLCTSDAELPAAQSRSLAAGGHASWAVTGALLAAGVTLLALDGRDARVTLLPTLMPGVAGWTPGGAGWVLHVDL